MKITEAFKRYAERKGMKVRPARNRFDFIWTFTNPDTGRENRRYRAMCFENTDLTNTQKKMRRKHGRNFKIYKCRIGMMGAVEIIEEFSQF